MPPIAPGYLLTWHTYGTWLHGDDAGSVEAGRNRFNTPRLAPDPVRFGHELRALRHPPLILSPTARILVDKVMRDHCRLRAWDLRALAVRSNHVHAVVASPTIAPEPIVKQLKEWGTRTLRSQGIVGPAQRVWTDHASTIYLYEPGSLEAKIEYVLHGQDAPPEGHGREDWATTYSVSPREP